jgi:formiminoglutamase
MLVFLQNSEAKYVIIGIPEDIGIRANFGRPGAASAWETAIKKYITTYSIIVFVKGAKLLF